MKRILASSLCSLLLLAVVFPPTPSNAQTRKSQTPKSQTPKSQTRNSQSGEIQMKLEDEKKVDTYLVTKTSILKKLNVFKTSIENLSLATPPTFNKEELTFLAATHLYCTLQHGVCTLIPFTLYETDLIRAVNQEKP